MTNQTTFRNLRYVLATIYDDDITARRVVQDAGLDPLRIAFSARAIDNWQAILSEAHKTARLNALLEVALTEYANNQPLRDAYDNYRRAADQPNPLDPIVEASLAEDAPAPGEPPFKGLTYFGVDDASIFFGCEQQVDQLVNHLRQARFLAVVGASGSGKSSLVRAGLVPAIQGGAYLASGESLPAGQVPWRVHLITPTNDPLEALADALTRDNPSVTLMDTIMADMTKQPRSLHRHIKRWLDEQQPASDGCLIMVDQFEELFTMCRDHARRQHFVDNLMTAVMTDSPTRVVLTLRADFYAHCAQFNDLREALAKNQIYIGPMTTDELRRAITEPAHQQGWTFEPGLVDLLLTDVGHEPGALPLLSHALLETWRRRRGRMLTLAGYVGSGRVQGAIAQTAERVFTQSLKEAEQSIAKNIFLRLTELGEGTEDTRRRIKASEVTSSFNPESTADHVLKTLVDARLIITSKDEIEVAHEALIREWPLLRQWLDEDRKALQIHRQLTDASNQWIKQNREPSYLYQGVRLAEALQWAEQTDLHINSVEQEFLQASQKAERSKTQLQIVALILIFVSIISALVIYAVSQSKLAKTEQEKTAQAQSDATRIATAFDQSQERLLLLASTNLTLEDARDPLILSGLLNVELLKRYPSTKAVTLAYKKLNQLMIPVVKLGQNLGINTIVFSLDGQWVISGSSDSTARTWDPRTGREIAHVKHTGPVISVAIQPDGQRVVSWSSNGEGIIWKPQTGKIESRIKHDDAVRRTQFSPNGQLIVSGSEDQTARVWESATGKQLLQLEFKGDRGVAFSPDGKLLAVSDHDYIRMWDIENSREKLIQTPRWGRDLAFSANSKWLVVGTWANGLNTQFTTVFDALSGQEIGRLENQQPPFTVASAPIGGRFIVGEGWGGSTKLAQITDDGVHLITPLATDGWFNLRVMFSPQGNYILSVNENDVRIWETQQYQQVAYLPAAEQPAWSSAAAFSPSEEMLAIRGDDGSAQLYLFPQTGTFFALHLGRTNDIILSNSKQYMALASYLQEEKKVLTTIWNVKTGEQLGRIEVSSTGLANITFSPDESLLAILGSNYEITVVKVLDGERIWTTNNAEIVASWLNSNEYGEKIWIEPIYLSGRATGESHKWFVWNSHLNKGEILFPEDSIHPQVSNNGTWVALPSVIDRTIVNIQRPLYASDIITVQHTAPINWITFNPGESMIATVSEDGLLIQEISTQKPLLNLLNQGAFRRVTFSKDGKWIIAWNGHKIVIWDIETNKLVQEYIVGRPEVEKEYSENRVFNDFVDISPNKKWLLWGYWMGEQITVWDIEKKTEIAVLNFPGRLEFASFNAPGNEIIIAHYDVEKNETILESRWWHPDDLAVQLCRRMLRNLSLLEWQKYFGAETYKPTCTTAPIPPTPTPPQISPLLSPLSTPLFGN